MADIKVIDQAKKALKGIERNVIREKRIDRNKYTNVNYLLDITGYYATDRLGSALDDNVESVVSDMYVDLKKSDLNKVFQELTGTTVLVSNVRIFSTKVLNTYFKYTDPNLLMKEARLWHYFGRIRVNLKTQRFCITETVSTSINEMDMTVEQLALNGRRTHRLKIASHILKDVLNLDYFPEAYVNCVKFVSKIKIEFFVWKLTDYSIGPSFYRRNNSRS